MLFCPPPGVMALKDIRTKDGFDVQVNFRSRCGLQLLSVFLFLIPNIPPLLAITYQMQTNQHSHFLLTQMVWKSIVEAANNRGEARVVTHSSSARHSPGGDLEKDFFIKCEPGTLGGDTNALLQTLGKRGNWTRYHQTKLANANFAMALHDKIEASLDLHLSGHWTKCPQNS